MKDAIQARIEFIHNAKAGKYSREQAESVLDQMEQQYGEDGSGWRRRIPGISSISGRNGRGSQPKRTSETSNQNSGIDWCSYSGYCNYHCFCVYITKLTGRGTYGYT